MRQRSVRQKGMKGAQKCGAVSHMQASERQSLCATAWVARRRGVAEPAQPLRQLRVLLLVL